MDCSTQRIAKTALDNAAISSFDKCCNLQKACCDSQLVVYGAPITGSGPEKGPHVGRRAFRRHAAQPCWWP